MNHAERSTVAALTKQFDRFAEEKRAVAALEIVEELARRPGALRVLYARHVREVIWELCKLDPAGGQQTWHKLLFLWCRERGTHDEVIADFFLDLVDELNESGEATQSMDQLALLLSPTAKRWVEFAAWEAAELNLDGAFSGLSSERTVQKLRLGGWRFDLSKFGRHPAARETLARAPEHTSDPVLRGLLKFFLDCICAHLGTLMLCVRAFFHEWI